MDTRDKIEKTIKSLMEQMNFDKITVTLICKEAEISRKTFYNFFSDKYDVIEQIIAKTIIVDLKEMIERFGNTRLDRPIILEALYRNYYNDKEFYLNVIKIKNGDLLSEALILYLQEIVLDLLKNNQINRIEREYIAYFYSSAQAMMIKKWIVDNFVLKPEELADIFNRLAVNSLIENYLVKKHF